jgi:hypothetical protein
MSSAIEKTPSTIQDVLTDHEKGEVVIDRHADLGLQYLAKHGRVEYTEEEERAVRWKIDLCLMPIVSPGHNQSSRSSHQLTMAY